MSTVWLWVGVEDVFKKALLTGQVWSIWGFVFLINFWLKTIQIRSELTCLISFVLPIRVYQTIHQNRAGSHLLGLIRFFLQNPIPNQSHSVQRSPAWFPLSINSESASESIQFGLEDLLRFLSRTWLERQSKSLWNFPRFVYSKSLQKSMKFCPELTCLSSSTFPLKICSKLNRIVWSSPASFVVFIFRI